MEEAAEVYHAGHVAQKAVEAKVRKKAEKQRLVEEEDKRKQLKYLKQLQNKVLAKNTALLESTGDFQIIETKHKKINSEDEEK